MYFLDSHITVPKVVYKEFLDGCDFYFKYDVKRDIISRGTPRKTFTEKDYYSDAMEKKLNILIERPLKELLIFCREIVNCDEIIVEDYLKEIAWGYFTSLFARNPKMCRNVYEESVFFQFLSPQQQHDVTVDLTMPGFNDCDFTQKIALSFLINRTSVPFVLPSRGFYEYTINDVTCYAIPLNPYVCLNFKEKDKEIHRGIDENSYLMIAPDMSDFVYKLNEFAFIRQKNDALGYVVSSDKNMLEKLRDSVNNHMISFDWR